MRWRRAEFCTYWGERKCTQSFGEETRQEEPLGRSRCKCGDNIKIELKEIACYSVDWLYQAMGRKK
jgi:hypothetical protein